jgi:hypothetical protein
MLSRVPVIEPMSVLFGAWTQPRDFPSLSQRSRPSGSSRSMFGSSLRLPARHRSSPARRWSRARQANHRHTASNFSDYQPPAVGTSWRLSPDPHVVSPGPHG